MADHRRAQVAPQTDREMIRETVQRARRIETRVTQLVQAAGLAFEGQKPRFDISSDAASGKVILPSIHSTLKEVVDSIPESWRGPVGVFLGEKMIVTLEVRNIEPARN